MFSHYHHRYCIAYLRLWQALTEIILHATMQAGDRMKLTYIDNNNSFDFGKTSDNYARFRDIYPQSMYDKLIEMGIGKESQHILDLGSGTAVLPMNLYHTGAVNCKSKCK